DAEVAGDGERGYGEQGEPEPDEERVGGWRLVGRLRRAAVRAMGRLGARVPLAFAAGHDGHGVSPGVVAFERVCMEKTGKNIRLADCRRLMIAWSSVRFRAVSDAVLADSPSPPVFTTHTRGPLCIITPGSSKCPRKRRRKSST